MAEESSIAPKEAADDKVVFALDFDQSEKEIVQAKARAGAAKKNFRTPVVSSSAASLGEEYEAPRSKNMLSHLTSQSALHEYKLQAARSLVRKQEDLIRNLHRMRENMERSEEEIGKATDYYVSRGKKYSYTLERAESRRQTRAQSEDAAPEEIEPIFREVPVAAETPASRKQDDHLEERNFEREIEEIKKRVANITKRYQEETSHTTQGATGYEYIPPSLPTPYFRGYRDLYSYDDPYEVTRSSYYGPTDGAAYFNYVDPYYVSADGDAYGSLAF